MPEKIIIRVQGDCILFRECKCILRGGMSDINRSLELLIYPLLKSEFSFRDIIDRIGFLETSERMLKILDPPFVYLG